MSLVALNILSMLGALVSLVSLGSECLSTLCLRGLGASVLLDLSALNALSTYLPHCCSAPSALCANTFSNALSALSALCPQCLQCP